MRNVLLRCESCSIRGTSTLHGLPLESAWTWVSMLTAESWTIVQTTVSFGKRISQLTFDKVILGKYLDLINEYMWRKFVFLLFLFLKGTNLSTFISNTMGWTAMTGCWGWCAAVWRSGPSTQDTSKPRPASFPASAQREPAHGSMSEEQTMTGRWPTLWRLNRWLGSFGFAAEACCQLFFRNRKACCCTSIVSVHMLPCWNFHADIPCL